MIQTHSEKWLIDYYQKIYKKSNLYVYKLLSKFICNKNELTTKNQCAPKWESVKR